MGDAGGNLSVAGLSLTFEDAASGILPDEAHATFPNPAPGAPYSSNLAVFDGQVLMVIGVSTYLTIRLVTPARSQVDGLWTSQPF